MSDKLSKREWNQLKRDRDAATQLAGKLRDKVVKLERQLQRLQATVEQLQRQVATGGDGSDAADSKRPNSGKI